MSVKTPADPPSRPTLRQEQAAVTRSRILTAARRLFFRDGYAATTLKTVAAEAGVAVQTVYAVFGSKSAILTELRWMVVDLPEAEVARREAMAAATVEGRLATFAHSIRLRWELTGDVVQIDQDAVRTDLSIKVEIQPAESRRQAGISAFSRALVDDFGLAIDTARLAAALDALTMYRLYAQLVGVHGWSPDEYEAWLGAQLVGSLDSIA
ncbi:TetR/AcrR family transcriptional regulator [Luteimicrobium sp. NPDC057192]|uniref:TetR/AcrR family transcriptional regulator n=1 Tax=Luteimicrobium sp. NPDC057192 TaxID=3346042 RepID=UPI00363E27F4